MPSGPPETSLLYFYMHVKKVQIITELPFSNKTYIQYTPTIIRFFSLTQIVLVIRQGVVRVGYRGIVLEDLS